jgi:cyclic pyranopterin phosphate synthase
MVDVSEKLDTRRVATAKGYVEMLPSTLNLIQNHNISKGNVLGSAKIAGIMAAKQTSNLIPLCHPLQISKVDLEFDCDEKNSRIHVSSTVKCVGKTGVEMEALISVSVACCTIYDMCKSVDKGMIISNIHVSEKKG